MEKEKERLWSKGVFGRGEGERCGKRRGRIYAQCQDIVQLVLKKVEAGTIASNAQAGQE